MTVEKADVLICGAGIAGISAAYHLAVQKQLNNVVLVDPEPPMSLTSDKSMECYRNWWPGPGDAMVSLMNRSIDLLEALDRESDHGFRINRRGYLYATADPARVDDLRRIAEESSSLGAGPVRYHAGHSGGSDYVPTEAEGYNDQPVGADVILDPDLIQQHFPYLNKRTVGVIHARRCGWFSGQEYGMYMLQRARAQGVILLRGKVVGITVRGNRIHAVEVGERGGSRTISTRCFVNAAGPFQREVGDLMGVELPVFCERHTKLAFIDQEKVLSRGAPLVIWMDPIRLPWSLQERELLEESEDTHHLLEEFPPGVHTRPEGGSESTTILIQWTYDTDPVEPTFPMPQDPDFPEIVLRGLAEAIPGMAVYFGRAPKPFVDGGYYTKTWENRPLIGHLPVDGAFIIGALSGYGLQASSGAGELLAAHVTGDRLPHYASAFTLERYEDPLYQELLQNWGASGQI